MDADHHSPPPPPQYSSIDPQVSPTAETSPAGNQSKLQADSQPTPNHKNVDILSRSSMEASSSLAEPPMPSSPRQTHSPRQSLPPRAPPTGASTSTSATVVEPIVSSSNVNQNSEDAGPSDIRLPTRPLPVHSSNSIRSPTDDDASSDWGYSTDFTRSAAPSPSFHSESRSDANSLRSRRSKRKSQPYHQYDNDQYVHDHLNDPNYTYRKS
ncbi:hypothetical protein FRB90_004107, partial [Tulasnella sp. 427]